MYKSTRFEHYKHPYWEIPTKENRKLLNRQLRTNQKKLITKGLKEYEAKDE
jgi:hypothetical protein